MTRNCFIRVGLRHSNSFTAKSRPEISSGSRK
jgi:hypothetical protein